MPKVVGIGGVFFRAADPTGLAEWYEKHLGIDDLHKSVWQQRSEFPLTARRRALNWHRSRRVTQEHRLVYRMESSEDQPRLIILQCRFHC
nr:type II toxin-antitoxin system YoeB family toxin [Neorhizobium galegae]